MKYQRAIWNVVSFLVAVISSTSPAQMSANRFCGRVTDPAGQYIAGARLAVVAASGQRLTATTGNDGSFAVNLPAWGAYTIQVDAPGFQSHTSKLELRRGKTQM